MGGVDACGSGGAELGSVVRCGRRCVQIVSGSLPDSVYLTPALHSGSGGKPNDARLGVK
ncbi:MAG: hypothetical protein Kow00106_11250 [Anaerolineae bacterium]